MTDQYARVAFDMGIPTTGSAESINVSHKRCECGGGECDKCLLDTIDRDLVDRPDFRHCSCRSISCFVYNYYLTIAASPRGSKTNSSIDLNHPFALEEI